MERAVAERANPYAPPDDPARHRERVSATAAGVLIVILVIVVALRTFRASLYFAMLFEWGSFRDVVLLFVPQPLELSWAVTWPLLVTAIATFCVWIYRANRDVRRLGAEGMFFSPSWSVLIGFIPIANLIGPYRAVREIYQASEPGRSGRDWMNVTVPAILHFWWVCWLSSLLWNMLSRNAAQLMPWGIAVAETLRALAALLLVVVVRTIERRLAEKAAAS